MTTLHEVFPTGSIVHWRVVDDDEYGLVLERAGMYMAVARDKADRGGNDMFIGSPIHRTYGLAYLSLVRGEA